MECFTLPFLSLFLLATAACNGSPQQEQMGNGQYGYTGQDQTNPVEQRPGANAPNAVNGGEQLTRHAVNDQKTGMVSQWVPLPSSWKIEQSANSNGLAITGPGGVRVYYRPGGTYTYSNDPYVQQTYRMAGIAMRAPVDIETYMQQDLAPYMAKMGMRLVKQYPLPQVAAKNEAYSAQLFKAAPAREVHVSMGSDWVNSKGEPVFVLVNMMTSMDQNGAYWNALLQMIESEPAGMEQAKAALIYSILNTQYNPQQIAAYNADLQRENSQSWAQHNAQMQDNKRNFDQRQQTYRETQDHINKSNMDAYNYRQQVNDGIQHSFNNYMMDEKTVRDNNTGERYQVETGANQYWMNNNNEYIKSNDAFYDPNLDQNVNNQQWQETEIEP